MKTITLALCLLFALTTITPAVLAESNRAQPTKDQLKEQFKSRDAELKALKKKGQVGETIDGYIDAVDSAAASDAAITSLLAAENKDRRDLYQLLADEINKENPKAPVKATMETIASRNAIRNIEHAGPDEFLRVAKDHWIRVKDFTRFQKITKFKTQGKVGETSAGLVEIVQAADKADKSLAAAVEEENARRTAEYKLLAEKEKPDSASIAKRAAARNIENARIGDMIKEDSGSWRKK